MKKNKSLILLSMLGILASCGGNTVNPPDSNPDPDDTDNPNKPNDPIVLKDFSELVKDLKTSFNVSGTIKLYQDEEVDNKYTLKISNFIYYIPNFARISFPFFD